jgi:hypothetical protein
MINEEKELEKQIHYFETKREKYGFKTSWCLFEIKTLSLKSPFKADYMTDGIHNIHLQLPNRKLTGKDLWGFADMLYDTIGDLEHRFIEEFKIVKIGDKTELQVFFGS